MTDPVRVWGDFNDLDGDYLVTSIGVTERRDDPDVRSKLTEGGAVTVYDGEGCECEAVIGSLDGKILRLYCDLATFRTALDSEAPTDG